MSPLSVLLLIALALRLIDFFAMLLQNPEIFTIRDADGYVNIARNLLESGAYSRGIKPDLSPDLTRPLLYPFLLAGLMRLNSENGNLIVFIHILLGTALAGLTYGLAREMKTPPWWAFAAGLLITLDPLSILTGHYYLSENLFLPLWIAGLLFFIKYWNSHRLSYLLISALLFALATLTRPVLLFFPILIFMLALFVPELHKKTVRLRNALLFIMVFVALLLPWGMRNQKAGGVFTLSTVSDINLYYYRAKAVLADAKQISQEAAYQQLHQEIDAATASSGFSPAQTYAYMRRRSAQILTSNPLQTLKMTAVGAARLLLDPGFSLICTGLDPNNLTMECFAGEGTMLSGNIFQLMASRFRTMTLVQKIVLIWSTLLMVGLYAGYLTGLAAAGRQKRWFVLALALVSVLYFVVLSSGAESLYRLRMPFIPILAVMCAYALNLWRLKRV